jgi:hypothetical protein
MLNKYIQVEFSWKDFQEKTEKRFTQRRRSNPINMMGSHPTHDILSIVHNCHYRNRRGFAMDILRISLVGNNPCLRIIDGITFEAFG